MNGPKCALLVCLLVLTFGLASLAAEPEPETAPEEMAGRRRDALNALARGEISADDAARVLRELT